MQHPGITLGTSLNQREQAFFSRQPSPTLQETEVQLVVWMNDPTVQLSYELSVLFDGTQLSGIVGGTIAKPGEKAQVALPTLPTSLNLIATHNHPNHSPLSNGDVVVATKNNLQEIRTVGKYGTFSLKRKNAAWPWTNMVVGTLFFDLEQTCRMALLGDTSGMQRVWKNIKRTTQLQILFPTFQAALSNDSLITVCKDYLQSAGYKQKYPRSQESYDDLLERTKPFDVPDGDNLGSTFKDDYFLSKHFVWKQLTQLYPTDIEYTFPQQQEAVFVAERAERYDKRV